MNRQTKIAKLAGVVSLVALICLVILPSANIHNFPLVGSVQFFLSSVMVLFGLVAVMFGLRTWRSLTWLWRIVIFSASLVVTSWSALDQFGTPKVEITAVYLGSNPSTTIQIWFGYGGVGNIELQRGEPWSTDLGRATPTLTLEWGEQTELVWSHKQKFDVSQQIPRFGSDRKIKITIQDDDANLTVSQN